MSVGVGGGRGEANVLQLHYWCYTLGLAVHLYSPHHSGTKVWKELSCASGTGSATSAAAVEPGAQPAISVMLTVKKNGSQDDLQNYQIYSV